jgi:SAM-dependent methyltransferase
MSYNPDVILEVIPSGTGYVLELGGAKGILRQSLQERGYNYVNIDIKCFENGEPTLIGDAHNLPFKDSVFDIIVGKDTLEHFIEPWTVAEEAFRILKPGGLFIIYVSFMYGFPGNDFYRYSSLGFQHLLKDFEIVLLDSCQWIFTLIGQIVIGGLKQLHLGFLEPSIKKPCYWLDKLFTRNRKHPANFAAAYRVVARKPSKQSA